VVCCVGTLGERKNQALLVEALAELAPEISIQAVLVGDGPAGTLLALAEARGVGRRVHIVGHRPGARRYPREADLLVLPSRSEGQPLAVLEAFCDGVPVIASAIPELAELVSHGRTGWLFASEDPRALAAAMLHAAQGPEQARAIAAHARACYRERFTVDRMVANYMAEYERAS
jgi:glycosyltransferase involved in cell wall biosynthesis